jgi:hypothetical protein
MSSLFGLGRPQMTSEQKIANVESEMRIMADTYNRYVEASASLSLPQSRQLLFNLHQSMFNENASC